MSYSTYITDALICGTWSRNTADRSYLLFTKEAGMLYAEARSVREERSRQRFALQDFSFVRASLIKGKQSWKVGSIESRENFYLNASSKAARGSVVQTVRFLRRFYGEQEAAPALFAYILDALKQLSGEVAERDFFEKVVQVHVLHELGYADTRMVPPFAQETVLEGLDKYATLENSAILDKVVEKAVSTSHL